MLGAGCLGDNALKVHELYGWLGLSIALKIVTTEVDYPEPLTWHSFASL